MFLRSPNRHCPPSTYPARHREPRTSGISDCAPSGRTVSGCVNASSNLGVPLCRGAKPNQTASSRPDLNSAASPRHTRSEGRANRWSARCGNSHAAGASGGAPGSPVAPCSSRHRSWWRMWNWPLSAPSCAA